MTNKHLLSVERKSELMAEVGITFRPTEINGQQAIRLYRNDKPTFMVFTQPLNVAVESAWLVCGYEAILFDWHKQLLRITELESEIGVRPK